MIKRALFIYLLVSILTACAGTNIVSTGDKFDAADKDGLLIVGLANEPSNGRMHSLIWRPFDMDTNTYTGGFFSPVASMLPGSMSLMSPGVSRNYIIHRVPAGTYALLLAEGVYGQFGLTTMKYRIIFRPRTVAVRIDPGEIVYVGDFVFAIGPGDSFRPFRDKFRYTGPNLAAVQEKLKSYPNIDGPLIYRKPRKVEIKEPADS